jgi:hypothetical protein
MSVESLKSLFDTVTVVLLFVTFACGAGALITGNIINKRQNQQLKQLGVDIAQANERAAIANRGAAEATKIAEGEKLARIQLEDATAWRRLSTDQRTALAASLSHYPAQRTWVIYNVTDVEAFGFASDLVLALAKWNPTEPEAMLKMTEGPAPVGTNPPLERGVVVSAIGGQAEQTAAAALVKELITLGFDAAYSPVPTINQQQPKPTVFISVEPRPEGPQGEAKLRASKKH